ncbi:MAG: NusG domain II-containing protein [Clostridia bacterium]|nr:NusG domain II-containing protein [Clostridia bacterium]
MRTKPTFWDLAVIGVVLVVAIALIFVPFLLPSGQTVTVSLRTEEGTEVVYEGELSRDHRFELENNGIKLTVVIDNGEAWVEESGCADGVCVNSGRISRSGQSIICAPAGVVISVGGGGSDDDILAQ